MRHHLAALFLLLSANGCSLLYNPNNLPPPNADADDGDGVDADPTKFQVDDVGPHVLLEGQGIGGSRPAILTLIGQGFVEGVEVELIAPGGEPVKFVVDNLNIVVASGGSVLAVPVVLPVDPGRARPWSR